MIKNNNKHMELQNILDSDDELPTIIPDPSTIVMVRLRKCTGMTAVKKNGCEKNSTIVQETSGASYNEEPDLPAYLDDQRFDPIKFNWIKKNKARSIPAKQDTATASIQPASELHQKHNSGVTEQTRTDKNLIKKGILTEQDILCMKGVAARTNDDLTLLWFIDFLMYKDLQSNYKFLKSCLVYSQVKCEVSRKLYSQIFFPKSLNNCFELVVK